MRWSYPCQSVDVGKSDGTGPVEVGGRAPSTRQTPGNPAMTAQTFPARSSSSMHQDPRQNREAPVGRYSGCGAGARSRKLFSEAYPVVQLLFLRLLIQPQPDQPSAVEKEKGEKGRRSVGNKWE